MTRVTLEPAWILHTRAWRDTSMLLEVLTRDHGRVGLVGRGVRGAKPRWRGVLQTLQPVLLSWSGRGELGTLTGCETTGEPVRLREEALFSAWYLHELLLRLLQRNDPHPPVFAAYGAALAGLANGMVGALRVFEKRLLDDLGWGPAYDHTGDDGSAVENDRMYGFAPDRGVLSAGGDFQVSGRTLLALAHERFETDSEVNEARRVLRAALDTHLGDRPMASRELLRDWRTRRTQTV